MRGSTLFPRITYRKKIIILKEAKKQLSKVMEEFDCFVGAKWDTLENEEKLFFDEDEPLKRKQRKRKQTKGTCFLGDLSLE